MASALSYTRRHCTHRGPLSLSSHTLTLHLPCAARVQESTWSDAFAAVLISDATVSDPEPRRPPVVKGANRLTLHELSAYATKLGQWQSSLTKSMGPLFSDPLRSLKRKIRLASHAPPATKEDEGVSSKRIKR